VLAVDVTYPAPVQASDGTDQTNITVTTPNAGSPVVGVTFVAPQSGRVRVHVQATPRITTAATGATICGVIVRAGATLGSGTVVFDGTAQDPGCKVQLNGFLGFLQMGASSLLEGLIAGATYNAVVYFYVGAGTTGQVLARQVGVDPLP
jgi:hypothetical protein